MEEQVKGKSQVFMRNVNVDVFADSRNRQKGKFDDIARKYYRLIRDII